MGTPIKLFTTPIEKEDPRQNLERIGLTVYPRHTDTHSILVCTSKSLPASLGKI